MCSTWGSRVHANQNRCTEQGWLRLVRPVKARDTGYSPDWVTDENELRHRPETRAQALQGAVQEWSALLAPERPDWSHELIGTWVDGLGNNRGHLHIEAIRHAPQSDVRRNLRASFMAPGPWVIVEWAGAAVQAVTAHHVTVDTWRLRQEHGCWCAERPAPLPGRPLLVVTICGGPPDEWNADRWATQADQGGVGYLLLLRERPPQPFQAELTKAERAQLIRKTRGSRPGRSGWKLVYLEAFPPWAQDAYWRTCDATAPSWQMI